MNLELAGALYEAYSAAVGGKAWNGDKLPTWEEFVADEAKQVQVAGWRAAADAARRILE